jgi:uncharacterized membrane protein
MIARSWRVWLVFLGVFLAGAVAGGFVSLRLAKKALDQRQPDDLALRIMQRFSDRLELTEAQKQAIQPHVERAASDMHRMRAQTAEAMERLEQAVARQLNPAQQQTLETMQAEQRERWKKWMEKREQERRAGNGSHGTAGTGTAGEKAPPPATPAGNSP